VAGPQGPAGPQGIQGPAGAQGAQGIQGPQGPAGTSADPWTYVRLTADFSTTSTTSVAVTGLGFAPAANKRYEFEGRLRLQSTAATTGAQPGINWPTAGVTAGAGEARATISATTEALSFGPSGTALKAASTAVPTVNVTCPGYVAGEFECGASAPTGLLQVTLASETGTSVSMKAGSWIRYREVP
jgi:hypothetical protein